MYMKILFSVWIEFACHACSHETSQAAISTQNWCWSIFGDTLITVVAGYNAHVESQLDDDFID